MFSDSYWEADHLMSYDVAVIGGGIIGMSTALSLVEQNPSFRIAVLERGLIPTGASTRNAGFACFGSLSELWHDITAMGGKDNAIDVVRKRIDGLTALRRRCTDEALGYEQHGGHELFMSDDESLHRIDELNALLEPLLHGPAFVRRDDLIARYGFDGVRALVAIPHEGTLHSGRMAATLGRLAREHGIHVATGALVSSLDGESEPASIRLTIETAYGPRSIAAGNVVVATNACIGDLCPGIGLDIVPARGQVLVTSPVPGLPFRGSFHFDAGFYYFRSVGERVLFGGGRNLDIDGERTRVMDVTPVVQEQLERLLDRTILPGRDYVIERRWAGTMGFSADKRPHVEHVHPRIVVAFGCNGMGVALGSTVGEEAARLVTAAG
ncbi:MAG: hypothetical protein BGO89_03970 [Candidatus Kapaibacterium thiocyanatum]|uniref:FAD dependent oxidoreductase domain-containing protein n=1 Tax=Candidatus Kapaibacterium thiocyanatum TaxID=1895771 RepID=A0A1M3L5A7_9BACT|nr:MAG: hypothetical protein BGO89_03970 ['Candidatus Kapabacteria' thiocyanatum]